MKKSTPDQFPQVTVGALILNTTGKVLLLKSHKWNSRYGLPAGKVEFGETLQAALRREVKEETGLDIFEIKPLMVQEIVRSKEFFRDAHFVSINYLCRTHSQEIVLNDESYESLWIDPEKAMRLSLNQPTRELLQKYFEERDKKS